MSKNQSYWLKKKKLRERWKSNFLYFLIQTLQTKVTLERIKAYKECRAINSHYKAVQLKFDGFACYRDTSS